MRSLYDSRADVEEPASFQPAALSTRSSSMPALASKWIPRASSTPQLDGSGRPHWAPDARQPGTPMSGGSEDRFDAAADGVKTSRGDISAVITFFVTCMLINCAVLNAVHFRLPDPKVNPPLRDFGFEILPVIRLQWIADSMLIFFNVTAGLVCLHAHFVEGSPELARRICVRYFLTWGYCILMRTCSIFLTSLPPTDNQCQNPKKIDSWVQNTILGFVTAGSKSIHCGDLLFSGHTINICVAVCLCVTYMRRAPHVPIAVASSAIVCWTLIIAARSHYSIDVFIGVCVTSLCWQSVPETTPWFLAPVSALLGRLPLCMEQRKRESPSALV